jgi:outer membrane lipoprotein-sorting protein
MQIRSGMILDDQGNRNRFDFVAPQVNLAVSPGQFVFVPPAGTTTIHP